MGKIRRDRIRNRSGSGAKQTTSMVLRKHYPQRTDTLEKFLNLGPMCKGNEDPELHRRTLQIY